MYSDAERQLIEKYADVTDELHTDLHECLGHGSGKLLPGVDPDALKAYGSTIEEARADLFGLYYVAVFFVVFSSFVFFVIKNIISPTITITITLISGIHFFI